MGQEQETIVVVGAGIAGLGTTMALHKRGQHVVLLDRDPPPPSEGPAAAFENWDRRGVAHLRQSHVFIGLLYGLIREEHPRLLEMLLEAGCRELRFEDGLPVELRPSYRKRPGDEEMTFLSSRRTTLELVMRRYVESLDGVEIRTGRRVREVLVDRSGAIPVLQGVKVTDVEGAEQTILGDVVVDACGRSTRFPQWLSEHGVVCQNDEEDAEIQYFTRHYRLLEGQEEPPRGRTPPNGDLTFLKFGVFPGDNGCFSITLALPTREAELRRAVKQGESFDRICSMLPGLAPWTDPQRAAPTSKVWGMGALHSQWRRYSTEGSPSILGFFAIGDSAIRTNPLYGRGCSSGVVQGHKLAQILDEVADPAQRAIQLEEALENSIRDFFDDMRRQDRQAIRTAKRYYEALAGAPEPKPTLRKRLARSFLEDGLIPASRRSVPVLRALLRSLHMLEPPRLVFRDPALIARIFGVWLIPKALKKDWYPPKPGPNRDVFLRELGLDAETA